MRVLSVAGMTRAGIGRRASPDGKPAEGTKIRLVYDAFFPPLTVVRTGWVAGLFGSHDAALSTLDRLRDFYGLDIRHRRSGEWWLVGEYVGSEYRDYFEQQAKREGVIS